MRTAKPADKVPKRTKCKIHLKTASCHPPAVCSTLPLPSKKPFFHSPWILPTSPWGKTTWEMRIVFKLEINYMK